MGGNPCRLKIIMNGEGIIQTTYGICEEITRRRDAQGDFSEDEYEKELKIVELFNEMENLADRAQRLLLESGHFYGPWPNRLKSKHSD